MEALPEQPVKPVIIEAKLPPAKPRVLSAMRPVGRLHLGHWAVALVNLVQQQKDYESFHMVADWQTLASRYENTRSLAQDSREMVIDWLSCALDPDQSTIFFQSQVNQIAELALLLGMFTPVPLLTRAPSYKEAVIIQKKQSLDTLGFLGSPVLHAAAILVFKSNLVPGGDDQDPHLEIARELVRRLNFLHGTLFIEPQPMPCPNPQLPGIDGLEISDTSDNCIYLSDSARIVQQKVSQMVTDPDRVKRTDPGNPDVCSVCQYQKVFNPEKAEELLEGCRTAAIGCVDCKRHLAESINELLEPMRKKRAELEKKPKLVDSVLKHGNRKASEFAQKTMEEVRKALGLL